MLKKAVFPVAGMGSRFLPATKANPKEMLPIVDKPLIQYAVEEAIAAGFTQMIFVTSSAKRAIEDHFDTNYELEARLERLQKLDLLHSIKNILPKNINCVYVRQPEPLGLGDAVLRAKSIVGNEPFAVLLADDLILSPNHKNCLAQMVDIFNERQSSVIGVQQVAPEDLNKYGIIKPEFVTNNLSQIREIVEKPKNNPPSNLAVAGRYILTPEIFPLLESLSETVQKNFHGEVQLTDAIASLLKSQSIYAYEFIGERFDCGSKLGYLKATIACALKHPELKDSFKDYLQQFKCYED